MERRERYGYDLTGGGPVFYCNVKKEGGDEMKTLEQLGISPAPWKTSSYGVCVDDTNGNSVATTDKDDDATNRADSRLIAAAQILYEACRNMLVALKNRLPSSPTLDELELIDLSEKTLAEAGGMETLDELGASPAPPGPAPRGKFDGCSMELFADYCRAMSGLVLEGKWPFKKNTCARIDCRHWFWDGCDCKHGADGGCHGCD